MGMVYNPILFLHISFAAWDLKTLIQSELIGKAFTAG